MSFQSIAQAGAWVPSKRSGVLISTTSYNSAESGYDASGNPVQAILFSKTENQFYFERGVFKNVAAVGSLNLKQENIINDLGQDRYFGVGNAFLGTRVKLWSKKGVIISVQPSAFYAGQNEIYSTLNSNSKKLGLEMRGLMGFSQKIGTVPFYSDLQFAHRLGFDVTPDEWKLDATIGIKPKRSIELTGQLFWTDSARLNQRPRFALPTESLKSKASIIYHQSDKTAYQFGFLKSLKGKNSIQEQAYSVSIWRKF